MNSCPPLISRVCHQSRYVAFKAGRKAPKDPSHRPPEVYWNSWLKIREAWQDHARDSAYLNWMSAYEPEYSYASNPLKCLAWEASHMSAGGSLMIHYLDEYFGTTNPFADIMPTPGQAIMFPPEPDKLRDYETLKQLPNWLVVMGVIVIYSDLEAAKATALLGLLGDAYVHVVGVSENARIEAFLNLAEMCERKGTIKGPQDFSREAADSMKKKLTAVVVQEFQSEELVAARHPAIMFRLCTRMCNHISHKDEMNC